MAIASSAAVDDTVTKPRAVHSASCIEPPTKATASTDYAVLLDQIGHDLRISQVSRCVCCSSDQARSLTTADPAFANASKICSRCARSTGTFAWAANTRWGPSLASVECFWRTSGQEG